MLEIHLLGSYAVLLDGVLVEIRSRPARTLLAYLALTPDTHHPREMLAGLLWPESTEPNARKNLRQALWHLGKAIGKRYLWADAASIALDSGSDFWLDVAQLQSEAGVDLATDVAVYEGELLPGFYEDWVLLERERLIAVFDHKMRGLLNQLVQEQRWAESIEWAERWIAHSQTPEAAYRALMLSHAAMGELAKANAAYQRCLESLRQELGVDPSDETRGLHEGLITGEAIPATGLEEYRALPRARKLNLPAQPTPFIGREDEFVRITDLLADSRLLALTGPGGIGKSRLALRVARGALSQFDDGVHFVDLAPIRSPGQIVHSISSAVGLPLSTGEDPESQLLRYLQGRRILLVMDNFEHVLEGAAIVSHVLQAAPDVKVLATSREKLELQGETVCPIGGMSLPGKEQSEDPLAYDAIELFVQSARRADPAFEPSAGDLHVAVNVCRMVDGMPLAIELAAAWLDTLSLEELEREVRRSLDILTTEMRDVPSRHRSIRAAFDHSWSLIGETEREAFLRLSVFRGGFTREAAQQVAHASLGVLASLVGKSLVRHDPNLGRFEIHELLRQYAGERLEADQSQGIEARDRHAAYFAGFAEGMSRDLRGSLEGRSDLAAKREVSNLRAALLHSAAHGNAEQVGRFVDGVWLLHELRGWNQTGWELFSEAGDELGAHQDGTELEKVRAWILGVRGFFAAVLGSPEEAIEMGRAAMGELRALGAEHELFLVLFGMNMADIIRLDAEELHETAEEGRQLAERIGDRWWEGLFTTWLGSANVLLGRPAVADRLARAGLAILEECGSAYGGIFPLFLLARLAFARLDYRAARRLFQQLLNESLAIEFDRITLESLAALGILNVLLGDATEAEGYTLRALRLSSDTGQIVSALGALSDLARIRAVAGDELGAVRLLAVVLHHPSKDQHAFVRPISIQEDAEKLRRELEASLPITEYAAAWETGSELDFDTVISALVAELPA